MCAGGVAPPTKEVGRAIVLGCGGMCVRFDAGGQSMGAPRWSTSNAGHTLAVDVIKWAWLDLTHVLYVASPLTLLVYNFN